MSKEKEIKIGLPGIQGPPGLQGIQGPPGLQGLPGLQGIQGKKGEKGDKGIKGDKGDIGDKGDKGDKGEQGKRGLDGKDGKDGKAGRDGKDGIDGKDGENGSPDTPAEVRDKLESLIGNERLDASAIKNLSLAIKQMPVSVFKPNNVDVSSDTNLAVTSPITLTGDTIGLDETAINHDNLSGFVANEHIDHSTVSIIAGTGMSGGGDITTSRTLTCTITQYTDALARAAISETVTGLDYNSTTGVLSLTTGYVIPTTTEESNWNTAYGWGDHSIAGYLKADGTVTGATSQGQTFTNGIFLADSVTAKFGNVLATPDYTIQWDGSDAVHTITSGDFVFTGGNVGIGTTSPAHKLEVFHTADLSMNIKSTGVDSSAIISMQNDARRWGFSVVGDDSDKLVIRDYTAPASRMAIDSSGNMGVGTTAPTNRLTVLSTTAPQFRVAYDTSWYATIGHNGILNLNAASTNYWKFQLNGSDQVVIDRSGNVGIGTTPTAGFKLHMKGDSFVQAMFDATGANDCAFSFTQDGTQKSKFGWDESDNAFKIVSDSSAFGSADLSITAAGNVGIGIQAPTVKLDVVGSIKSSALSANRVTYATTGGQLTDSGNLTYNGTAFSISGRETIVYDTAETGDAITITRRPAYTSSVTQYAMGLRMTYRPRIEATFTQAGYNRALWFDMTRYYPTGGDAGTINEMAGVKLSIGNESTEAGAVTTNVYGITAQLFAKTGTITNAYMLHLPTRSAGGTVTNYYGIYQQDTAANNYLAGDTVFNQDVIIGAAAGTNPGATLDVRGSAIFNEAGADVDFRVEGVGRANALLVQGSDGFVGLGRAPNEALSIAGTANSNNLAIYNGADANIVLAFDVSGGGDLTILNAGGSNTFHTGASASHFLTSLGVGTSTVDRQLHSEVDDATNNDITHALRLTHTTSGTPATNIGVGMEFEVETSNGNNEILASISTYASTATAGSEDGTIIFKTMAGGAAATENFRISPSLIYTKDTYPIVDNTYYLGKNSITAPKAWKGLVMKDQTNGNYYLIDMRGGVVTATQIT